LGRYVDPPELPEDRPVGFMELGRSADVLGSLEEYLHAGRIETASVYRPDPQHMREVRREDLSAEEWRRACEEHREDPDQGAFWIDAETGTYPHGARRYPADVLVKLIGAYVLAGEPLEPLLEELHPNPREADREQLERLIHGHGAGSKRVPGMIDKARQIARAVRGGRVGPGNIGEVSQEDMFAAWQVSWLKSQGRSYEEIHELLKSDGYTKSDIHWLGSLDVKMPESGPASTEQ
jgi:hypothetical protein